MSEHWVLGPPGTGKTTYISRQIERIDGSVCACSFTKAAAVELSSRNKRLSKSDCGTLHSFCYRALDAPDMAETSEGIALFNSEYPHWRIGGESVSDLEEGSSESSSILTEHNRLRGALIPEEEWPKDIRDFGKDWLKWKSITNRYDFTDLIEACLYEKMPEYETGFFDEAQDFTPLEIKLIRRWSKSFDRVVLAGDDDQCLYAFKGADPADVFPSERFDPKLSRVLSQSYRVPKKIHGLAERWISNIKNRVQKEYKPTDIEGEIQKAQVSFDDPTRLLDFIDTDRKTMILTSCSYMLKPIISFLRERGIPFHNPYRQKQGAWNPLSRRGKTVRARLQSYLKWRYSYPVSPWTYGDIKMWLDHIKSRGVLCRGAKKHILDAPDFLDDVQLSDEDLIATFTQETLSDNTFGLIEWFRNNLTSTKQQSYDMAFRIYDQNGLDALDKDPNIVVGTIHSVKGGEAQDVLLFPDLSANGYNEFTGQHTADRVIRQFYVAITRASERLLIGDPSCSTFVKMSV